MVLEKTYKYLKIQEKAYKYVVILGENIQLFSDSGENDNHLVIQDKTYKYLTILEKTYKYLMIWVNKNMYHKSHFTFKWTWAQEHIYM